MTEKLLAHGENRVPLILGHRGSPVAIFENTVASYLRAFEDGADGIELDVRATADGVLVCHHDPCVPSGEPLTRLSFARLQRCYARQRVQIPALSEVLATVAGRGLVNIELKVEGVEAEVARQAARLMPAGSYVFSSFRARAVAGFCRHAPQVPALLIVSGMLSLHHLLERLRRIGATGISLRHRLVDRHVVAYFHRHRIPILAYTVNHMGKAELLAAAGVAGLMTDLPGAMVSAFRSGGPVPILAPAPVPA